MEQIESKAGAYALVPVIQELSAARDLETIMHIVAKAARQIAGADGATFVLKENGFCYYADEEALSPLWKGQRFPLNTCVSGWCMMHAKPLVIPDIENDDRIPLDLYRETFVRSLALTPIRARNPLGAIGVYWSRHFEASVDLVEMLTVLSEAVATAMENLTVREALTAKIARLERENRVRVERMMTVSQELRNPLNAILGWSELLSEGSVAPEELPTVYATLFRNARVQTRIVGDILQTSEAHAIF